MTTDKRDEHRWVYIIWVHPLYLWFQIERLEKRTSAAGVRQQSAAPVRQKENEP
jgi:hypothetical protein